MERTLGMGLPVCGMVEGFNRLLEVCEADWWIVLPCRGDQLWENQGDFGFRGR